MEPHQNPVIQVTLDLRLINILQDLLELVQEDLEEEDLKGQVELVDTLQVDKDLGVVNNVLWVKIITIKL